MPSFSRFLYRCSSGSVLILTIMFLVLISLQVAVISLVAVRSFGDEGMLMTQNLTAKRSAETAINRLESKLYNYLIAGAPADAATNFAQGQTEALNGVV